MTRNLKALGLALVAMLAMSAVAASGASAQALFHSEEEATTLTIDHKSVAHQDGQRFTTPGGEVFCPSVGGEATVEPKTTGNIRFDPIYPATESETSECKVKQGETTLAGHIDMNTCYYTFTSTPDDGKDEPPHVVEAGHKYRGEVHINCDQQGDSITVNATFLGERQCIHIPEQTPTSPYVDYTNEGEGKTRDITLESTVEGIEYTLTSFCGGHETRNDATYDGTATITGEDHEKNHVGIWVG